MVVQKLQATRDAFMEAAAGLGGAQYAWAPAPDCWSIGQIVEHVAIAERRILAAIGTLPQAPPPSEAKTRGDARFARLDAAVPSRTQRRITAPEPLLPRGTWPDPHQALAAFVDARAGIIAAVAAVDAAALEHVIPHRIFGEFDLEEWAWFTALHSARHAEQIEEIKAAPGFPPPDATDTAGTAGPTLG